MLTKSTLIKLDLLKIDGGLLSREQLRKAAGHSHFNLMAAMSDTADNSLLLDNGGKRSFIHPVPQRQLRWTVPTVSF